MSISATSSEHTQAAASTCMHPGHRLVARQTIKLQFATWNPTGPLGRMFSSTPHNDLRSLHLVCLSKEGGGDKEQALGIAAMIKSKVESQGVANVKTTSIYIAEDNDNDLQAGNLYTKGRDNTTSSVNLGCLLNECDRTCFIVAGASPTTVGALSEIPHDQRCMTILSAHQLPTDLAQLNCLPEILALPRTSVSELDQNALEMRTDLRLGDGVAHNFTPESIKHDAAVYQSKHSDKPIPDIGPNTVSVVLPGDAPDETGKMKCFTQDHARALARRLLAFEQGVRTVDNKNAIHWLVTNGPRTGNHDTEGRSLTTAQNTHRTGKVDVVTTAFLDELSKSNQHVDVFDFQFTDLPSAFKALVNGYQSAKGTTGNFHIPGESTSMVSEVTDYLDNVVVDEVPCMNTNHQHHVNAVLNDNRADILSSDGQLKARERVQPADPSKQVSAQVADRAVQYLNKI